MKKRLGIVLLTLAAAAGIASFTPVKASAATLPKLPAACVVRTAGPLHLQIGYCPR